MAFKWVGMGVAAVLAACGGSAKGGGEPPDVEPVAGAGAGGRDDGADPNADGEGGREPFGGAGAGPVTGITELDRLAGRSFTFSSSLCSSAAGSQAVGEPMGVSSIHVRGGEQGGLEIVTYTRAGGAPIIEVHPLERAGDWWKAKDVVGCAWLDGYEDFRTESESADWSLQFRPDGEGGELELVVTAAFDESKVSARAKRDVTPPVLSTFAEAKPFRGSVDDYSTSDFSRNFVFSEPLAKSEVMVKDRHGEEVTIGRYLEESDYVWGFTVTDHLSSDAQISGYVEDLAGLGVQLDQPYPGIDLAVVDGDFEEDVAFETSDIWVGEAPETCGQSGAEASLPPLTLPPIAGQWSFHVDAGWDHCSIFFRLARNQSSTKLSFIARRIVLTDDDEQNSDDLWVCVSSLDAGNDRRCSHVSPPWMPDQMYTTQTAAVSLPSEISVDLPLGDDLWVEIETEQRLWLDSFHTQ